MPFRGRDCPGRLHMEYFLGANAFPISFCSAALLLFTTIMVICELKHQALGCVQKGGDWPPLKIRLVILMMHSQADSRSPLWTEDDKKLKYFNFCRCRIKFYCPSHLNDIWFAIHCLPAFMWMQHACLCTQAFRNVGFWSVWNLLECASTISFDISFCLFIFFNFLSYKLRGHRLRLLHSQEVILFFFFMSHLIWTEHKNSPLTIT